MAVFGKGLLTAQESVELDQQSSVGVVRLGSLAVARTDVVVVKIDTHGYVFASRPGGWLSEKSSRRLVQVKIRRRVDAANLASAWCNGPERPLTN